MITETLIYMRSIDMEIMMILLLAVITVTNTALVAVIAYRVFKGEEKQTITLHTPETLEVAKELKEESDEILDEYEDFIAKNSQGDKEIKAESSIIRGI